MRVPTADGHAHARSARPGVPRSPARRGVGHARPRGRHARGCRSDRLPDARQRHPGGRRRGLLVVRDDPAGGYSEVTSAGVATGLGGRPRATRHRCSRRSRRQTSGRPSSSPCAGRYLQASAAVLNVARHLQERGVVAAGLAFGRFESESHWEVGYPVPPGTAAESPFDVVTLPGGPVASLVVRGPWGQDSAARWSRLLAWLGEHGYVAVGPPTETWSGDAAHPDAQVTVMSISVVRSRR